MNKDELIEVVNEMIDNGCGMVEVFEFIEDYTDLDLEEIIMGVML